MKQKLLTTAIVCLLCIGAHAQVSQLLGLTKTKYSTAATAFMVQDSAYYMYTGTMDTSNAGGLAYDSSYTLAYLPGVTTNGYSYRYYQLFDGNNNITQSSSQYYDTASTSWINYQKTLVTYNSFNYPTTRILQVWDAVNNVFVNSTQTVSIYNSANLSIRVRQTWDTAGMAWKNATKDSFGYDAGNDTIYHLVQAWDTTALAWTNTTQDNKTYNGISQIIDNAHQVWDATAMAWDNNSNTLYSYNAGNLLANTIVQHWDTTALNWVNYTADTLVYISGNYKNVELKQLWVDTTATWNNLNLNYYTYDGNNNMLTDTTWNWSNTNSAFVYSKLKSYTYNNYNQVKVYNTISWSATANDWQYKNSDLEYHYYYSTDPTTAVSNVAAKGNSMSISPVPAAEQLNIQLQWATPQASTITIYNVLGDIVYRREVATTAATKQTAPVGNLPGGNYIVVAAGNGQRMVQQVVVAH